MAELQHCPTCWRPVFVPRPPTDTKPDPLKHCPRALAEPLSTDGQQHYLVACLVIGIDARDKEIERVKGRAKDALRGFLTRIDEAIAEQGEEEPDA